MEQNSEQTLYELLGVEFTATSEEIREAFHSLARLFHPDSQYYADIVDSTPTQGQVELFKKISNAYSTLSDPVQRAKYDGQIQKKIMLYGSAENEEEAQIAAKLAELGLGEDVARIAGVNLDRAKKQRRPAPAQKKQEPTKRSQSSTQPAAGRCAPRPSAAPEQETSWWTPKGGQKSADQAKAAHADRSTHQQEFKKFRSW